MARLALLLTVAVATFAPAHALWPLPKNLQSGASALALSASFSIDLTVPDPPSDLQDAVARTAAQLAADKLGRLVVGRGASDAAAFASASALGSLTVALEPGAGVKSISDEAVAPLAARNEAYTLVVPADGSAATLTANSTLGLLRGLTTFSQLWYHYNGTVYTVEAPFDIDDAPAYVRELVVCGCMLELIVLLALPRIHAGHGQELVCSIPSALVHPMLTCANQLPDL